MYEERRDSFSLRDIILQVLFVALFIFILMWLFPTKSFVTNYVDGAIEDAVKESLDDYEFGGGINSEAFSNQLFNQNVLMMKDAAKDYFTLSRLPEKTGDNVKITLKQMLAEKIILPFVDSKGESCDVDASYVNVTKTDTEYLMKVNLKCSDYEDYLLVHMGCYDYCSTTICETKTPTPVKGGDTTPTPSKTYEYEYKLVVDGKWGEWSEWSEWTTNVISKTEYNEVETKIEKVAETYQEAVNKVEVIDATANVTYTCPTGYTKNETAAGTTCVKTENSSNTINAFANVTYSCPNGYAQNGNTCVKYANDTVEISANKTTTYTCPSGYTKEGTKCTKTIETVAEATKTVSYTCPSGYTKSGSKCTKTNTINATASTSYTDWSYSGQTTSNIALVNTNTTKYVVAGTKVNSSCTSPCTNKYTYTYNIYKRSTNTTYTCPSGYTKSGSKCLSTSTVNATASTTYTCPSGYSKNGNTCYNTETKTVNATASTKYACFVGYSLTASNTCVRTTSNAQTTSASMNTTYSCPSGYELFGNLCFAQTSNVVTINPIQSTTYTCPSDYKQNGNKCEKVVLDYVESVRYKDVTYYHSRTKQYISGQVYYAWSKSQNDISLIKQGYTLTGNSRVVE